MDNLPVILISAASDDIAAAIISELIDNDVSVEYTKDEESSDNVWRLINKYYMADVRVHVLTDDRQLELNAETIEAQIIYIAEDELQGIEAYASSRVERSCGVWSREGVERIVLAECASPPGELVVWCDTAPLALLVPRREPTVKFEPGPFAETSGLQRLRDALHAHMWSNLQRTDAGFADTIKLFNGHCSPLSAGSSGTDGCGSDDDDEWGSDVEWQSAAPREERVDEQAQLFAAVLHAARALRAAPHAAPRRERLHRAESLLRAMCRDCREDSP